MGPPPPLYHLSLAPFVVTINERADAAIIYRRSVANAHMDSNLSRRAWRRAAIAFYDEYLSTVTDNALQRHQQNVTLQQQSQQRQKQQQQQQQQQQEQSSSSSSRRQSSERGKVNNQLWA